MARGGRLTIEEASGYEAVALFLDRALAARPGLVVAPGEVAALVRICYQLDGIPLALELAAARARALSLGEIADRLGGRFDLLAAEGAGPARHQTLQASVEWSHQLLDPPEQVMFRRLGVFSGGWSLAAAEAVVGGAPVADAEVAGVLARLVDKSLAQVEQYGGESRYRLAETIRVFAHERLAQAGELDRFREAAGGAFRTARRALRATHAGPNLGPLGVTARPRGRQLSSRPGRGATRTGAEPGWGWRWRPGCGSSGLSWAASGREPTG